MTLHRAVLAAFAVIAVMALAAVLAGCGDGGTSDGDETASVATPTESLSPEPEAAFENAGTMIGRNSMVWSRRLGVPVEDVWEAVSTKEGLAAWWITDNVEIDLRVDGVFSHAWQNTITELEEHGRIVFRDDTFGSDGFRFDLEADGEGTVFSFTDTWADGAVPPPTGDTAAEQPGGPGTPWVGVGASYHQMVDSLETYLTGATFERPVEELYELYAGYLTDYFAEES